MTQKKVSQRLVRLHKFIADAGVVSRRRAEELIEAGRVLVNGVIVDKLPAFVDPATDKVVVDGTPVRAQQHEYFILHKPKAVVCTNRDPAGRLRAIDLLPPMKARVNVVGRLDVDSTGLVLLTNDGELAEKITHPRFGMPKVYRAEVRGQIAPDVVAKLKKGIHLAEGKATASAVEILHRSRQSSVLRITLREGRNRQVRRMLARLEHPVKTLKRVAIGPLTLKGLPVGACRALTAREISALRKAARSAEAPRPSRKTTTPTRPASRPAKGPAPRQARATPKTDKKQPQRKTGAAKPKPRRRLIT